MRIGQPLDDAHVVRAVEGIDFGLDDGRLEFRQKPGGRKYRICLVSRSAIHGRHEGHDVLALQLADPPLDSLDLGRRVTAGSGVRGGRDFVLRFLLEAVHLQAVVGQKRDVIGIVD